MSGVRDVNAGAPNIPVDTAPQADAPHVAVPAAEPDFESQFGDLFRHDPFAKNAGEPQVPAIPQAAPIVPAVVPPVVTPTQPNAQADPVAPPQPQSDPNALVMRDTAAALAAATQNLNNRPQGQNPPAEDPALNYMYDIPAPLAAELSSDDPARRLRAQSYLQGAMAKEVHTRMRAEMQRYVQVDLPQYINSMLQAHTFRETVQRDFYDTYKQLRSPHLAPTVKHFTSEVLREEQQRNPNLVWTPQLRDAIAERIFAAIPGLRGTGVQPPNPAPQPQPQPPRVFTNGARPAAPTARQDVATDIMDTLFG